MTDITNTQKETPKQRLKANLDNLHNQLQECTPDVRGDNEIEHLKEQARVLNKVMLRMLSDADERYDMLIQYGLALRAQNQFRQTVQTVDTLNRREEKRKEKEWEDYVENLKNPERYDTNFSESSGANYTNPPKRED